MIPACNGLKGIVKQGTKKAMLVPFLPNVDYFFYIMKLKSTPRNWQYRFLILKGILFLLFRVKAIQTYCRLLLIDKGKNAQKRLLSLLNRKTFFIYAEDCKQMEVLVFSQVSGWKIRVDNYVNCSGRGAESWSLNTLTNLVFSQRKYYKTTFPIWKKRCLYIIIAKIRRELDILQREFQS